MILTADNDNLYKAPASSLNGVDTGAKKPSLLKGRISRATFWKIQCKLIFCAIPTSVGMAYFSSNPKINSTSELYLHLAIAIICLVLYLYCMIYGILASLPAFIRRWHDLGKTSKYFLLLLVPWGNILAILWILYMCCFVKGEDTENKYGSVPEK